MPALKVENPPRTSTAQRSTFFRQSGWLMIANIGGGILMWGVHFLSHRLGPDEYRVFGACLAVVMCLPTIPLQMVLAHQTAQALATHRERELAGMVRQIWLWTSVLWLAGAVTVLCFQGTIIAHWKVSNPSALWVTLPVVLLSIWL